MVTMESAYYKGRLWCAYELKDEKGRYYEEYRLEMRKESQKHQFICPECMEPLILCAGPIMEPFFKHYENSNCTMKSLYGKGNFLLGRRILYQLARRSFPLAAISMNPKLSDRYYGGVVIEFQKEETQKKFTSKKISIEFITHDMNLSEWEEKMNFYLESQILPVWILNSSKYRKEFITTFEYLITKESSEIIKVLNPKENSIYLKKRIPILEDNGSKIITSEYFLDEVLLLENGEFDCDFELICDSEKEILNREYRFLQSAKKETGQKRIAELKEIRKENLHNSINQLNKRVVREIDDYNIVMNKKKMKIKALKEVWTLPDLEGKEKDIIRGNQIRYSYLKEMNASLSNLNVEQAEERVGEIIDYLEMRIKARDWIYGLNA